MRILTLALLFAMIAPMANGSARLRDDRRSTSVEWCIAGKVAAVYFVPALPAWDIVIEHSVVNGSGTEYIDTACEESSPIYGLCPDIPQGAMVEVCGYVRSNEPNSGLRLSVTEIRFKYIKPSPGR